MRSIRLTILLYILSLWINPFYGQSLKDTAVVDFKTIDVTVREKIKQYGAENVLVVLDIDNTLLTGDTDLGSDIWYLWQSDELDLKPTPEQKLEQDCVYKEAIGLLYELGTMSLTDSLLPGYIENWQKSGVTVFALTSRSPDYRTATERELQRNNIFLQVSQLTTLDDQELSFSYILQNRKVSYSNGIFMTSGLNKGDMLSHILGRSGRTFKAVVFADDGPKNIAAVRAKYSNCHDMDITLFHYTRIFTDRREQNHNVLLTPEQADKMDRDWDGLIYMLNTIFPERLEKSECGR
jgi:hypothetical protein